MKRRHFLLQAASGLPCCLIPAELISNAAAAFEAGDPIAAIGAPERAKHTLYAVDDDGRYKFFFDSTEIAPAHLTWRQWIEIQDYDLKNPRELREALIENWLLEEDEPLGKIITSPEALIPDSLQEHYLEGAWAGFYSPQAQACHYLQDLKLGNAGTGPGDPLGELAFFEGAFPGTDFTGVETDDDLILPALQRRLLELGEEVCIEVRPM